MRSHLALLFLVFFASCDTCQEESRRVRVLLNPEVLDFGRVRASEQPLILDFFIENKSSRRLTIEKILPSCGCTLCDVPSDIIPPKGSVAICTKVFLKGYSGDFAKDVIIKIVGEHDPLVLPIRGYIDDTLSYSGQTLRCTVDDIDRVRCVPRQSAPRSCHCRYAHRSVLQSQLRLDGLFPTSARP